MFRRIDVADAPAISPALRMTQLALGAATAAVSLALLAWLAWRWSAASFAAFSAALNAVAVLTIVLDAGWLAVRQQAMVDVADGAMASHWARQHDRFRVRVMGGLLLACGAWFALAQGLIPFAPGLPASAGWMPGVFGAAVVYAAAWSHANVLSVEFRAAEQLLEDACWQLSGRVASAVPIVVSVMLLAPSESVALALAFGAAGFLGARWVFGQWMPPAVRLHGRAEGGASGPPLNVERWRVLRRTEIGWVMLLRADLLLALPVAAQLATAPAWLWAWSVFARVVDLVILLASPWSNHVLTVVRAGGQRNGEQVADIVRRWVLRAIVLASAVVGLGFVAAIAACAASKCATAGLDGEIVMLTVLLASALPFVAANLLLFPAAQAGVQSSRIAGSMALAACMLMAGFVAVYLGAPIPWAAASVAASHACLFALLAQAMRDALSTDR